MKVKKGVSTITTSSSENYTVDVVTFEIDGITHGLCANVTDGRYETYPPYNFSIHDNVDLSTESGTIAFFRNATGYNVSSYTWTTALTEVSDTEVSSITSYADGWEAYGISDVAKVRKSGNVVTLSGAMKNTAAVTLNTTNVNVFTIPEGFRPPQSVFAICNGSGINRWHLTVQANGKVMFSRYGVSSYVSAAAGSWFPFTLSWVVE